MSFQLTVFDGFGASARDVVIVKMNAAKPVSITAAAGTDQIVDEGDNVQLQGTCNDKLGREMSYSWVQTIGPYVELSSTGDADTTFIAPEIPNGEVVPTAFRFTCQAETGGTATDVVLVRVRPVNDDPTADAGKDKNTMSNRYVYLEGTGTDPDGDVLKYSWKQVGGDDVTLVHPNTSNARFKTPEVSGGASTQFEFELTVSDPYGGKSTDTVSVSVVSDNLRASADAGADQVVDEQTLVTLTGSGSDPENESLTYSWKQVGGERVELDGADSSEAMFTSPIVANGKIKVVVFELRVADENGSPAKDTIKVTVLPVNSPPVVNAGDDQTVDVNDKVSLSGTATDEDGEELTYLWNQIAGPTVQLSTGTELDTTFVAPKTETDAVLTFQLIANDGQADSEPDTVDITVKGQIVKAMTAYAGKDQTVSEESQVNLFGTGKDPLKNKINYSWKQISGESVTLSSSTISKPSFTAPLVSNGETKTLVFELTVSDGSGRTAKDTVTITVEPINSAPQAIAKVKSVREAS